MPRLKLTWYLSGNKISVTKEMNSTPRIRGWSKHTERYIYTWSGNTMSTMIRKINAESIIGFFRLVESKLKEET